MINESNQHVFKGVWIPAEIWETNKLTWMQKIVWGTISSLGRNGSPCRASNEWLAERMKTSEQSIAQTLSRMRSQGFIKDAGFDGRRRSILAIVPSENTEGQLSLPSPHGEPCINRTVNPESSSYIEENKEENKEDLSIKIDAQKGKSDPKGKVQRQGKVFVRPSIEDVQKFCVEIGLTAADGAAFWYGKQANGWMNGKSKIKSWKATVRQWQLLGYMPSQKKPKEPFQGQGNDWRFAL